MWVSCRKCGRNSGSGADLDLCGRLRGVNGGVCAATVVENGILGFYKNKG
ncbi:hypothetical protein Hanom_Chr05g00412611 [Helianthus anomalus]